VDPHFFDPEDPVSETHVRRQAPLDGSTVQSIVAALTVIKGHAQLIRRRVKAHDGEDTPVLERSLAAIELSVQRIVAVLTAAAATDSSDNERQVRHDRE
jgi:hypothetical protein